jgi:4-cresol dehydrogenase (hydroxylating) flavoprotein subunit
MTAALETAVNAWQDELGQEYVDIGTDTLARIAEATFKIERRVLAILKPKDSRQVQACMRIANRYKVPVYVVSTGKNWGNGSSVPTQDECVVMHLGRMNDIKDFNEKLAYVTIEPGVTQGQLAAFLKENQSNLWVDITGAPPECSLIGNIMERGHGHSAYSNRVDHISGLSVVLPNGDIIQTGFGKYPDALAAPVYPWGLGPSLDGLFTQSNLGIVTSLTMWLMPKPEAFECFYFLVEGEDGLEQVIDALQPLRLKGIIKSGLHIGNNYKAINTYGQYPWELAGGRTPLPKDVLKKLAQQTGCEDWNGSGALYGTRQQVADAKRQICSALKGKVNRLNFLTDFRLSIIKRFPKLIGYVLKVDLVTLLPVMEAIYGLSKGIPSDIWMSGVYWRKKQAPPAIKDPDHDRCGLIWYSPVAPLEGRHAVIISNEVKKIMLAFSFEPLIAVVFFSERVLSCVISIAYDRDVQGEDDKAMQCHDEIVRRLAELGYYPYRLGVQNMSKLPAPDENYLQTLKKLKDALDPDHILSPGRYEG